MTSSVRFEIYKDVAGGFRWRARSTNGKIVADSGEAYKRRWGARHAAVRFVTEVGQIDLNLAWMAEVK